jgi:ADP-heptose:LPS heptosyltransferase
MSKDIEAEVIFLGSQRDYEFASKIIKKLTPLFAHIEFINSCGKYNLQESLITLSESNEFWGVDSSLIHYARILKIKTVSWWGPTDPKTRLREIQGLQEETYYCKIPCSPCIHVTETPPCMGDNVCIENLFNDNKREWTGLFT